MRLFHPVAFLICLLVVGCSHPSATLYRESGVLLLDNHGGFSHAGRRIALRTDGSYTDTTYTDVIGDEHTKVGHYTLNPERTFLVLSPEGGVSQELFRVDYGGQQYWVREADRERITQSSESWLRQISVTVVQAKEFDHCRLLPACWLETEVKNGGFYQYFFNAAGDNSEAALAGLKEMGAADAAELLERAMAVFPGGKPPEDRDKRREVMQQIATQAKPVWEKCDSDFNKLTERIGDLSHTYAKKQGMKIITP